MSQDDIDWALRLVENSDAVILMPNAASVRNRAALVAKLLTSRGREGLGVAVPRIYLVCYGELAP